MSINLHHKLQVYCLKWHLNKSPSCDLILREPLAGYLDINFDSWNDRLLSLVSSDKKPLLFWQIHPPKELLIKSQDRIITWAPMWDAEKNKGDEFWSMLPKNLQILAFSDKIYQFSKRNNLKSILLQFMPKPAENRVNFNDRVLFYWNRDGLIGKSFLEKLCRVLAVKTLYFRDEIDPHIDKRLHYTLSKKCAGAKVIPVPSLSQMNYEDYHQLMEKVNIYIAPRKLEGIGLTYLEALSRGCFVLACDAAAMNEYIIHQKNGWLFNQRADRNEAKRNKLLNLFSKKRHSYYLDLNQDWETLKRLDLEKIGDQAWRDSRVIYSRWIESQSQYSNFLVGST